MTEATAPSAGSGCPNCSAPVRVGARFCAACGTRQIPGRPWRRGLVATAGVVVLAAIVAGYLDLRVRADEEEQDRQAALARTAATLAELDREVAALSEQAASLAAGLRTTREQQEKGLAPLASRVLRSVFTIEADFGSGSGWSAWTGDDTTFIVTAFHVVEGSDRVMVRRKTSVWNGRVVRRDEVNDLALIRVDREIGTPLWQDTETIAIAAAGDELLLIGSPYGLEGTVTTGIVSRVTYNAIQTDAAANPGNSGGPAVNANGEVVGILLWGGGQNVNFAVPIQRACVKLRHC